MSRARDGTPSGVAGPSTPTEHPSAATGSSAKTSDFSRSPIENLKESVAQWGDSAAHRSDDDDDEGSEHELLLDPLGQGPGGKSSVDLDSEEGIALKAGDEDEEQEDSPYAEVRAAVHNYDQDLPCNTVRAWVIGLSLVVVGASMNTLFSLRQPSIGIGPLIAQIVAWPLGHGWARVMPEKEFNAFGIKWSLNPGPFNVKEHGVIVVMASVSFSVAYATDIILAQLVFYKQNFGIPFQLMLTISTQSLGYGIAGIMRKFLGTSVE